MPASARFASILSRAVGAEIGVRRSKRIRSIGCMRMSMCSMGIGCPEGCRPGMALRPGCEETR